MVGVEPPSCSRSQHASQQHPLAHRHAAPVGGRSRPTAISHARTCHQAGGRSGSSPPPAAGRSTPHGNGRSPTDTQSL